jgi:DNA-binding MarR family transcriptional regulator
MHWIPPPIEEVSLPALLRLASGVYASAVRQSLVAAGFDDIPRDGVFVIGSISRAGAPLSEVIRWLGVSKQTAGQLVDTLVLRGYLERTVDDEDRRRLRVSVTDRGRAVAALAREAIARIDEQLRDSVAAERIAQTRATLAALIGLRGK